MFSLAGNPDVIQEQKDMESIPNRIITAKTKLSDRNMVWKEAYTSRTLFLKKQFHEVLGPGSYFRFEGYDTESGDEYFVVVGPAKVHQPKAEFFAGVRKLPADFSAGGLYFHDMKEAMEYAVNTWGVNSPSEMEYYDSTDLKDISQKVKDWKEEQDEETNSEGYLQEWYKSIKKEGKAMPVSEQEYFYMESSVFPYFVKVAMAKRHNVQAADWYDIDDVVFGSNDKFNENAIRRPSMVKAAQEALKEKTRYKNKIAEMYGARFATDNAALYQIWLITTDVHIYLVSIGPYCGKDITEAVDKFGCFQRKLNVTTLAEITKEIERQKDEYSQKYGIELEDNNFNVSFGKTPEEKRELIEGTYKLGEINLSSKVKNKFFENPAWRQMLIDVYQVDPDDPNAKSIAIARQSEMNSVRDKALAAAYKISQENGDAFKRQQPPPPSLGPWERYRKGQQQPTTIKKQNVGLVSDNENAQVDAENVAATGAVSKIEKFGFDSIAEAVTYLNSQSFSGAPISEVPDTTSDDLKAARLARIAELGLDSGSEQGEVSEPVETTEQTEQTEPIEEIQVVTPKPVKPQKTIKSPAPVPVPAEVDEEPDFDFGDLNIANSSLLKMIKIAEELDANGKTKEAKEMHNILKKHIL
jgi:hypothetical protein